MTCRESAFPDAILDLELYAKLTPIMDISGASEQLDAERAVMALFSDPEHAYSWKAAYFYFLSNSKHFLEQILVRSQ